MKQCNSCGTEISDEAAFCPACGKPLTDASAISSGGAQVNGAIPKRIESHLVKAIISTACCCLPFGIVAIMYAVQIGPNLRVKNFEAALEASKKADLWSNLAIAMGIIMQVLLLIYFPNAFFESLRANFYG